MKPKAVTPADGKPGSINTICGFRLTTCRNDVIRILLLLPILLSACSSQRYFYYPNRILYVDPERMGLTYETVQYPSLNGKTLYGLYFKTAQTPQGTIVHFHGNYGNVSNHFQQSVFLIRHGFDVLIFDYEGYGASEGVPSPQTTLNDGLASVRYAQAHLRQPGTGVGVFGQSLGGSVAVQVAAQEPLVKAVVLEAPFSSYRAMSRVALQRHWLSWPLSLFMPLFIHKANDPIDSIERVAPRPLLIIHGNKDMIVPPDMSVALYQKAREPKTLWMIDDAGHLECHRKAGKIYEDKLAAFFSHALATNTN